MRSQPSPLSGAREPNARQRVPQACRGHFTPADQMDKVGARAGAAPAPLPIPEAQPAAAGCARQEAEAVTIWLLE